MSKFGMLQLKVNTKIKDSEIIAQKLEVVREFCDKRNIELMVYFDKGDDLIVKVENEESEDEDNYDYIQEYDELIDDYKWCLSFFEGVNQIVDFCTNSWEDASNIRIVYFTC